MSEGILGEVFEEEDDKSEGEKPEGVSANAFAIAVAARLSSSDPEVARETSTFLRHQSKLLEMQTKHLEGQHGPRLHFLEGQAREVDLRRFSLRLRVGSQLFLALVVLTIGFVLALMIHDAVTSRSVVLDPFDVAPNIASKSPSGKMIAAGLLDVLTRIQAANRSSVQSRALSNAWTNEIAIEVPETGISVAQIERALKARFAHDQHIEGDLSQTEAGNLALTVRGTNILPKTFSGDKSKLEDLLSQAGEYIYGQSQPGLWVAYLSNNDRNEEAISFAESFYATVDPSERPYVLNYWANAVSSLGGPTAMRDAMLLWQESVRLKPDFWLGYNNIMFGLVGLGDEEADIRVGKELLKAAGGRPGRAPEEYYGNYDLEVWDLSTALRANLADLDAHRGIGTTSAAQGSEVLSVAQYQAQMHELGAAILGLKTAAVDPRHLPDVAAAAFDRALIAEELGEVRTAAAEWDSFAKAYKDPTVSTQNPSFICFAAVTYERNGESAKADAAFSVVEPFEFVDCDRFRADVLEMRGDWQGAQRFYEKAVKHAPSAPAGYYSWGVALSRHGDFAGAIEKLHDANVRGPHWADPLEAWGNALFKLGKPKEALLKYQEALKYAPHWKQLEEESRIAAR
jgi:tetratricopeptide (TPR) repeat protein